MELICPLCGGTLTRSPGVYACPGRHSFDIARQGYVNLLTVGQKHSLTPGDTREQVLCRRSFLEAGFYRPISDALNRAALDWGAGGALLDVGCGEGYYSARLAECLGLPLTGIDISKEAVRCAAARYPGHTWLCATASHLPVGDGSAGTLSSLFAVTLAGEFRRVLTPGGLFLQVLAAEDHLLGLKSIVYDEVYRREKNTTPALEGFRLLESRQVRFDFRVEGEQVRNLFAMTPHLFRIGRAGAARLAETETLSDTASCVLNIYRAE